ncbi:uncharacterized protein BBA_09843 [Beauveria bassiana ARSEF 2860]|uniref:Uncharacterized protein n=1 Tax=Beauveria bassiana (strain ARSEF 2860) TaxID=655819 RepID=J4VRG6_BEAB2|nr:uncharacterized protein BBA_09843 [Beauveria bassiana ARSEF 2860]EJP61225.1 hypothetical protein BBA_09843 [Beauveria bassiana ARSEF 2860]
MSAVDAAHVLANRVKKLGICGNVPALLVYERPSSVWHVTHHCPQGMAFPDLNAMMIADGTSNQEINHNALRKNDNKQREVVRKRGPSIERKTQRLGRRGKICVLLYQWPVTGIWRQTVCCPDGKALPDLNALLELHEGIPFELRARPKI